MFSSSRLATALLALFLAVAAARLVAIPADLSGLARVSTYALMPSLALWVLARRGPILVVAALLFSAAGDALLGVDGLFIAGMGAFAVAHVLYVTQFVRSGALHGLRRRWFLPVGYAVALVGLIIWLWPGLGDLRIPVAAYALLLTATAVSSGGLGLRLGLGGGLFFVSDAMIAAWDIAERPEPPMPGLWVMSTYILAQYLLASGARGASRHDAHADPQLRDDGDLDRQPGDGDQRVPGLRPVV
jgi:uncharacterized membrane protein YhhN